MCQTARSMHKYFPEQHDDFELHHADGVELEKWSDQSEVFDAVISDPICNEGRGLWLQDWDIGKLDRMVFP